MNSSNRAYLVISRVGNHRFYEDWLSVDRERNFDLFLSVYTGGIDPIVSDGVFVEKRPGKKVEGLSGILTEYHSLISRYKFFCFVDDDLEISINNFNRLFEIAEEGNFRICQPSLTHDSYFTYAGLLQNISYKFRCVSFIEMMCPVFRWDMLPSVIGIYALGYESGIDLIWCNIFESSESDFAVVDEVAVKHTCPVGLRKSDNGFVNGMRYEDQVLEIMSRFDLPWLPCVPYFGITADRCMVKNRFILFASSIKLVKSIFIKDGVWGRARSVLVHWKHLVFSKPKNLNIDISCLY